MKFRDYITEQRRANSIDIYSDKSIEQISEFWETIQKDCKKFLKDIKPAKSFLYRGMRGEKRIVKKKIRKDRRPVDTDISLHDAYDRYFKKEFGWEPRSNGLFTTGNRVFSSNYGTPYIIFPIDNYKFIWSPEIKDLYTFSESKGAIAYAVQSALLTDEEELRREYEETFGEGKRGNYIITNIPIVLGSDKKRAAMEALKYYMKHDPEYAETVNQSPRSMELALGIIKKQLEWEHYYTFEGFLQMKSVEKKTSLSPEEYDVVVKRVLDSGEYTDKNIVAAIKSGSEVMIGTKEYWAIDSDYELLLDELIFKGKTL